MNQKDLVPPMRNVSWETIDNGKTSVIIDHELGRRIKIDERGREIAFLLDRPQTLDELSHRIAEGGRPIDIEALRKVISAFKGLGLLDEEYAVKAIQDHERMNLKESDNSLATIPLIIPEDLRFSCQACGSCCVGTNIGPVGEKVMARLKGKKLDDLQDELKAKHGLFFASVNPSHPDTILCSNRRGACIFLENDGLCKIHRRYGVEYKPEVCRLFPFQFIHTPEGIVVSLQLECREIIQASKGKLVKEQENDIRTLLMISRDNILKVRPFCSFDGKKMVPYEEYQRVEKHVIKAIQQKECSGIGLLLSVLDILETEANRLSFEWRKPEGDPSKVVSSFNDLIFDIADSLENLKKEHSNHIADFSFRSTSIDKILEAMNTIPILSQRALTQMEGLEGRRFARLAILNWWHSKEALHFPNVLIGVAIHGFQWFLARLLATTIARKSKRLAFCDRDLVDGWVIVSFFIRNKRILKTLNRFYDRIMQVFLYDLRSLVRYSDRLLDDKDNRDFFLF